MKLSGREVPDACRGEFADVDRLDWPCKYIEAALDADFIARNENFRPKDLLTKTEAMKLVLKSRGIEKVQTTDNWQEDYMKTALHHNIIFEEYTDYDTFATRGWLFSIASLSVINEGTAGLTEEEVYKPEPVKEENSVLDGALEQFVSIYRNDYETKTVVAARGESNVVLWEFSLQMINIVSDEQMQNGIAPYPYFTVHKIVMKSDHDDLWEVVERIWLYDKRNDRPITEVLGEDIRNGQPIVFDFEWSVNGWNQDDPTFELRATIRERAVANTPIKLRLAYTDTGLDPDMLVIRDEEGRQITDIQGYHEVVTDDVAVANDGLKLSYSSNDLKYIHQSARDIEIGEIRIERQFGPDHDGKFDYGSITLEKNENTPGSRIADITLVPHNGIRSPEGNEISGQWNGKRVTFDISSSSRAEFFSVLVDMTDTWSEEEIRDEVNFGIQDFTAYDSDGDPMTIVIDSSKYVQTDIIHTQVLTQLWQKLTDSEYADVSLRITQPTEPQTPTVAPKVADYAYAQKISSFTITAEDGNVFVKNIKLRQLPHSQSDNISYVDITDGEYEPVWSGEISEDGTLVDVWIEIFAGVSKTFHIQVFQVGVIEPGLGNSFDIMDIEAISELGEPRNNRIQYNNIEWLERQ